MLNPESLFDLSEYECADIFANCRFAWEALSRIEDYIREKFSRGLQPQLLSDQISDRATIEGDVYIGEGTILEPDAYYMAQSLLGKTVKFFRERIFEETY